MPAAAALLDAWLGEIGRNGWRRAHAGNAARRAGIDAAGMTQRFGDKYAAAAALLDSLVEGAAQAAADGDSVRERLFDAVMDGFDQLQAQRDAVQAMWQARDPRLAALATGRLAPGVRRLALAAGIGVAGWRGQARLLALAAILWRVAAVWRRDDSADMSATMAELDRLLEKAEQAATEGLGPELLGLPGLAGLCRWLRPPASDDQADGDRAANDRAGDFGGDAADGAAH